MNENERFVVRVLVEELNLRTVTSSVKEEVNNGLMTEFVELNESLVAEAVEAARYEEGLSAFVITKKLLNAAVVFANSRIRAEG